MAGRGDACLMEGGLDMATRKRLANRFRAEYARGTKKQKGEVLDRLVAVGMGRSTARRLLSQAVGSKEEPGPGRERHRAQQRQVQHPQGRRPGDPPVPVPGHLLRLRQRHGVRQRRAHRPAPAQGHRTDPQPPVQEERPGHRRVQEQPRRAKIRVLLEIRHRGAARPTRPAVDEDLPAAEPVHPHPQTRTRRTGARRTQEDRLRPAEDPMGARAET